MTLQAKKLLSFMLLLCLGLRAQHNKFFQTNPDALANRSYLYMDPVNLPIPHDQIEKANIRQINITVVDMKDSTGPAAKKIVQRFSKKGQLMYKAMAVYELKAGTKKYDTLSSEFYANLNDSTLTKTEFWPNDKGKPEKTRTGYLFYDRHGLLLKDSTITFSVKDTVIDKYFYANGQCVKKIVMNKHKISSVHYYYWSGTKLDSYKDENRNANILYQMDFDEQGRYLSKRVKGGVGGVAKYDYFFGKDNELVKVLVTQSGENNVELRYEYDEKGLLKTCYLQHYKEPVYKYRFDIQYQFN